MTFHSFRRALTGTFLALAGALLLNGCGGGGAAANTQGNILRILPENSTVYAGVPVTMSVVGGRAPYILTSSEPQLFPVPNTLNGGFFTVIPNNPGVVDTGLATGSLPIRTVTLQARDATGLNVIATVRVGQNFLTSYGLALTPSNCPQGTGAATATNAACAGGTTAVRLQAAINGNLHGNEVFRLEVVRGNFSLRNPVTGQVSNAITLNSDHTGTVTGLIEVPAGVARQVAVIRTIHVPTGVYADQVFIIDGAGIPGSEPITAIPNSFTFTGATTLQCGTGIGDFLVFGGVPPYTATSTNLLVSVSPTVSTTNPGRFTISVSNPTICVADATIVVTDSLGNRTNVTVTTAPGTTAPPDPTPITIAPTTLTLTCGVTGSVAVVGGVGPLSVTSSHPRVTAVVSGTTLSVTRSGGDGAGVFTTGATIAVTDGTQIATLAVTVPANCP